MLRDSLLISSALVLSLVGCGASTDGANGGGGSTSASTSSSASHGATGGGADGGAAPTGTGGGGGTGGSGGAGGGPATGYGLLPNGLRDKLKWPFASDSIWNTPIGSHAQREPAGIVFSMEQGSTRFVQDQDVIVMHPEAPLLDVSLNNVAWSGGDRCPVQGKVLQTVPIPDAYTLASSGENNSAAFLDPTGMTLLQNEPFTRCVAGGPATTNVRGNMNESIYGAGITGAHGGSGLSAIGGTIRLGELPSGVIHHALKVNLWAHQYYHCCSPIWPATNVDGYAHQTGKYGGQNPAFGPGSLLALDPTFDVSALRTVPGKIVAQAFKDYGAYVVDDTYWNAWAIETEQGPDGRVVDEFQSTYGFSMAPTDQSPFWLDIEAIYTKLEIVTNNSKNSIGGGGTPRVPLAPAIGN